MGASVYQDRFVQYRKQLGDYLRMSGIQERDGISEDDIDAVAQQWIQEDDAQRNQGAGTEPLRALLQHPNNQSPERQAHLNKLIHTRLATGAGEEMPEPDQKRGGPYGGFVDLLERGALATAQGGMALPNMVLRTGGRILGHGDRDPLNRASTAIERFSEGITPSESTSLLDQLVETAGYTGGSYAGSIPLFRAVQRPAQAVNRAIASKAPGMAQKFDDVVEGVTNRIPAGRARNVAQAGLSALPQEGTEALLSQLLMDPTDPKGYLQNFGFGAVNAGRRGLSAAARGQAAADQILESTREPNDPRRPGLEQDVHPDEMAIDNGRDIGIEGMLEEGTVRPRPDGSYEVIPEAERGLDPRVVRADEGNARLQRIVRGEEEITDPLGTPTAKRTPGSPRIPEVETRAKEKGKLRAKAVAEQAGEVPVTEPVVEQPKGDDPYGARAELERRVEKAKSRGKLAPQSNVDLAKEIQDAAAGLQTARRAKDKVAIDIFTKRLAELKKKTGESDGEVPQTPTVRPKVTNKLGLAPEAYRSEEPVGMDDTPPVAKPKGKKKGTDAAPKGAAAEASPGESPVAGHYGTPGGDGPSGVGLKAPRNSYLGKRVTLAGGVNKAGSGVVSKVNLEGDKVQVRLDNGKNAVVDWDDIRVIRPEKGGSEKSQRPFSASRSRKVVSPLKASEPTDPAVDQVEPLPRNEGGGVDGRDISEGSTGLPFRSQAPSIAANSNRIEAAAERKNMAGRPKPGGYQSENAYFEKLHQNTKGPLKREQASVKDWLREKFRQTFVTSHQLKGKDVVGIRGETRTQHNAFNIDDARQKEKVHRIALEEAFSRLSDIIGPLKPGEDMDLLSRYAAHRAMLETLDRNDLFTKNSEALKQAEAVWKTAKLAPKGPARDKAKMELESARKLFRQGPQVLEALEIGVTRESATAEVQALNEVMKQNPHVVRAYQRHLRLFRSLGEELVERGLIHPYMRQFYLPRVIADFVNLPGSGGLPRGKGASRTRPGNVRQRKGTIREASRDYPTIVARALAQTYEMIARHELVTNLALRNHFTLNPISPEVAKIAETWKPGDEVPLDHVTYDLRNGFMELRHGSAAERVFGRMIDEVVPEFAEYLGLSVAELEPHLRKLRAKTSQATPDPTESSALVVIPKAVAETMALMAKPDPELSPLYSFTERAIRTWKSAVIHVKPIRYNWNNLLGDSERAVAQFGKEPFTHVVESAQDVWQAYKDRSYTVDYEAAHQGGVTASGLTTTETGNIYSLPDFAKYAGKKIGPVQYARMMLRWFPRSASMREDVMRLAIFKMNMRRWEQGKDFLMGVTDLTGEVSAILKDTPRGEVTQNVQRAAALVARRSLIDYGDFTMSENQLRNSVMPFYAWVKGNGLFWGYQLPKSVAKGAVGKGAAGTGALMAGTTAILAFKAAAWAWNNYVLGDAEELLPENEQSGSHIIVLDAEASMREGRPVAKMETDRNGVRRIATIKLSMASDDFLENVGLAPLIPLAKPLLDGELPWSEFFARAKEDLMAAPIKTAVTNLGPVPQTIYAAAGVRPYPDPLHPVDVPDEERWSNILRATGILSPPGAGQIMELMSPTSVAPKNIKLNPLAELESQMGYREFAEPFIPGSFFEADLTRRIVKAKSELDELKGRITLLAGGLRKQQLTPDDRDRETERLIRRYEEKTAALTRLAERYSQLYDNQKMQERGGGPR
jgi:hypothetical protein